MVAIYTLPIFETGFNLWLNTSGYVQFYFFREYLSATEKSNLFHSSAIHWNFLNRHLTNEPFAWSNRLYECTLLIYAHPVPLSNRVLLPDVCILILVEVEAVSLPECYFLKFISLHW